MARADPAGKPIFSVNAMTMARTIVIILHYRGVADTIACVASVVAQCHDGLSLLVVDNGSSDGLGTAMETDWPSVPVLRLATNTGWAGGNNAGIEWARRQGADVVCLLNNDTVVPAGVFDRMRSAASRFGLCLMHPAIDFADPAEGVQLDPSRAPGALPVTGFSTLYEMNYAYGACLMVPMTVFDQIGGFDERFFLQLEESDFYERARRRGIPAVCETSARIFHAESRSFGGRVTAEKSYYRTRNTLLLMMKNPRNFGLLRYFMRQLYWNAASSAQLEGRDGLIGTVVWSLSKNEHAVAIREGIRDFVFRRFGARRRR
jgi:GT2 family glycosyltransferase